MICGSGVLIYGYFFKSILIKMYGSLSISKITKIDNNATTGIFSKKWLFGHMPNKCQKLVYKWPKCCFNQLDKCAYAKFQSSFNAQQTFWLFLTPSSHYFCPFGPLKGKWLANTVFQVETGEQGSFL